MIRLVIEMIGKINQYEDVRQLKLRSAAAVSECGSSFSDVLNSRIGEEKIHFSNMRLNG